MRTKKDSHKQGSPCVSSSPLKCFEPVMPAYNQSRPYSWLKLRASTYNQLWISMPAVLVTVPNATQNSLSSRAVAKTISVNSLPGIIYELSPLLLAILWILWRRKRWQRQTHRQSVRKPPHPDYRCPHLYHPGHFMPNAHSAATLQIYPGFR